MDVRLQDAGYVMPTPKEFNFEVPEDLTIMQDSINSRGGKRTLKGQLYEITNNTSADQNLERAGCYGYKSAAVAPKGIPALQAFNSGQLSPQTQLQLVTLLVPPPMHRKKFYTQADVPALMSEIRSDPSKLKLLQERKFFIATEDKLLTGDFGRTRELDMSKDPPMYSFKAKEYDLILSFNPRTAPDFVQDRIGWNGEGMTDKRYLRTDIKDGLRMIYLKIKLTRDDIVGVDSAVLFDDSKGIGLDKIQK